MWGTATHRRARTASHVSKASALSKKAVLGRRPPVHPLHRLLFGLAAAFGFLRRVPLGRLFAETALGAALGGLIGFAFVHDVIPDLLIASVGFALAVAQLAWRYRRKGEADQQVIAR